MSDIFEKARAIAARMVADGQCFKNQINVYAWLAPTPATRVFVERERAMFAKAGTQVSCTSPGNRKWRRHQARRAAQKAASDGGQGEPR